MSLEPLNKTDTLNTIVSKANALLEAYNAYTVATDATLESHNDLLEFITNIQEDKLSHKLYAFKSINEFRDYYNTKSGDICVLLGGSTMFDGDIKFYRVHDGTEEENLPNIIITTSGLRATLIPDLNFNKMQDSINTLDSKLNTFSDQFANVLSEFEKLYNTVGTYDSRITEASNIATAANTKITNQLGNIAFSITSEGFLKVTYEVE